MQIMCHTPEQVCELWANKYTVYPIECDEITDDPKYGRYQEDGHILPHKTWDHFKHLENWWFDTLSPDILTEIYLRLKKI